MNRSAPSESFSFQMTEPERKHLAQLLDYSTVQWLPQVWSIAAQHFPDVVALHDPHAKPEVKLTYSQLLEKSQQFAAGLQALGLSTVSDAEPPRIALLADNSVRWCIADRGIMTAGGVDVVRSSQADADELLYILHNSGSTGLVVENLKTLQKLRSRIGGEFQFQDQPIEWVVLLSDEDPPDDGTLTILNYTQLMEAGNSHTLQFVKPTRSTLATLLYTSGTTGRPKGVMLSHGNLMHQLITLGTVLKPQGGDRVLSILPTWHSFGRTAEYFLLSQGVTQIYTNIRHVKQDFKQFKPQYMVGVPRLWESIYEGAQKQFREQPESRQKLVSFFLNRSGQYINARRIVQGLVPNGRSSSWTRRAIAALQMAVLAPFHALGERLVYRKVREATGGQIKAVLSGGGSLAMHLENFFEIVGLEVIVGYGLTETAPVLTARRSWVNLRGSAGKPIPGTEIKIVDPDTRQELPVFKRGLVLARGPQVMQGYYQNPTATQKAIDPDGWFDTGDLGLLTPAKDLILTGRAKDTIVLTNGENIEPQPIEDACTRSPYINQMMLVGQDQKQLGALIVPNLETLTQWAMEQRLAIDPQATPPMNLDSPAVQDLIRAELIREVKNRPGYRADDRIGPFGLILEPFSIENGMMTQTLKIKRPVVRERYRDMIDGMF